MLQRGYLAVGTVLMMGVVFAVSFRIGDSAELDRHLESRGPASATVRRVQTVIARGTMGKILTVDRISDRHFGIQVEVEESGSPATHLGQKIWMLYKEESPGASLFMASGQRTSNPRQALRVETLKDLPAVYQPESELAKGLTPEPLRKMAGVQ